MKLNVIILIVENYMLLLKGWRKVNMLMGGFFVFCMIRFMLKFINGLLKLIISLCFVVIVIGVRVMFFFCKGIEKNK